MRLSVDWMTFCVNRHPSMCGLNDAGMNLYASHLNSWSISLSFSAMDTVVIGRRQVVIELIVVMSRFGFRFIDLSSAVA